MFERIRCPWPRSIPAWAGKPGRRWTMEAAVGEVHPRVGGETRSTRARSAPASGPSPRGRVDRLHGRHDSLPVGSIPAWAGKPSSGASSSMSVPVHPRVGGETDPRESTGLYLRGPSPRGRGNQGSDERVFMQTGSIPAWAGKPDGGTCTIQTAEVHPRVGGETAFTAGTIRLASRGPSPRGRGNHRAGASSSDVGWPVHPRVGGETDAMAGGANAMLRTQVHPRVGGETPPASRRPSNGWGPSPRGRGNRWR